MLKRVIAYAPAAFVLCSMGLQRATANPVLVNGDFETGNLTGWTWTPDGEADPGMAVAVTPGPFGSNAFRVNPGSATIPGTDQGGTLSQIVSLDKDIPYTISGDLAIRELAGTGNVNGGTITVTLGSTVLHVFDVAFIEPGALLAEPFVVNVTPEVREDVAFALHFTRHFFNSPASVYHWADNLSIVPEPGTLALLLLGGLLGLRRLHHRR